MDWTEHRHHMADSLGRDFLAACEQRDWIKAARQPRALMLTSAGRYTLERTLQIDLSDIAAA